MPLAAKVIASTVGTLVSLEVIHSIIGVAKSSKFGKYSIGRVVQERIEKKIQADEEKQTRDKIKKFIDNFCNKILKKIVKSENCGNTIEGLFKKQDKDLTKILNKIGFTDLNPKSETMVLSSEEVRKKQLKNKIKALIELLDFFFMIDHLVDKGTPTDDGGDVPVKIEYAGCMIEITVDNDKTNFQINDDDNKLCMTVTQENAKYMATFYF